MLYTAANGTQGRRVGMVVCDREAAVPLTLFAPAEGALPAFAPGKLLSVAGASMETYLGELKCRTWLDRVTLEPLGSEAAALRQWWASRPASYVAPSVTMHPLVAIDSVPSLPADTYVRVVAVVLDAEDVATAPTSKGGEASRRMLTIADASGKSIELTIWAPRVQDIGGDAGYVQVTRTTGDGPVLLVTPHRAADRNASARTAGRHNGGWRGFEGWRPLKHEDQTPRPAALIAP